MRQSSSDALNALPEDSRERLKVCKQPGFLQPMKAVLAHDPFDDADWLYERKFDGVRCLAHKKGNEVKLFSRNRKDRQHTYPEITAAFAHLPGDLIVDCEIVAFAGNVTDFSRLQRRMQVRKPDRELVERVPVFAYVFDILYLEHLDLRQLPLRDRKQVLKAAFHFRSPLRYVTHRHRRGRQSLQEACKRGWEGLIAKNADSIYVHKRSSQWMKFKCGNGQELVIAGFTAPKGSRQGFGALLLGYYENGDLCYAGRVGTGFSDALLESLHRKLARRRRKTCPFDDFDEDSRGVTWVTPELVGEIGFTEWTGDGKLRHPRFLGLRDDKKAKDIVRERAS